MIVVIGGNRSLSPLRRGLTPSGTLIFVGGEGGNGILGGAMLRSTFGRCSGLVSLPDLQALNALVESGQVTEIVDRTYSLPEAADAVHNLESGRTASGS